MIPILYEKTETNFDTLGVCRLSDILSCVVTEERNGIFECDFEYPVSGANFDKIVPGRIIYCWHDDTEESQPFDIVSYSKPINGVVTFHAVHVSYRQSYITTYGTNINSLADALTMLKNGKPNNPFTYFTDKTSTGFLASADGTPRSVRQFLGGIEGSILDAYGGEYKWNGWSVQLLANRGRTRALTIRYGVNLLNYEDQTDYQGVFSSCIPYWTGTNDEGAEVVIRGSKVNSGNQTYTGRDECVPLDLTDKFEGVPTVTQLNAEARSFMQRQNAILPAQTITVDFVRLSEMGEFEEFKNLLKCELCDTIRVLFPQYGVDSDFKIVKTIYDVLRERYESMELGQLSTTLAEALGISEGTERQGFSGGNLAVDNLNASGGVTAADNMQVAAGKGYWLEDRTGFKYPGVRDNGVNMWLGAMETAARHHTGQTYISTGYDGSAGNETAYLSVPNANNDNATNYGIFHTGYKPTRVVTQTYSNVACTIRSGSGAYYSGNLTLPSSIPSGATILGVTVSSFNNATASFVPICNGTRLYVFSDVSQTIGTVVLRIAYQI